MQYLWLGLCETELYTFCGSRKDLKLQEKVSDLNNITSPAWGNLDVTWGAATHTNHTEEKATNKRQISNLNS